MYTVLGRFWGQNLWSLVRMVTRSLTLYVVGDLRNKETLNNFSYVDAGRPFRNSDYIVTLRTSDPLPNLSLRSFTPLPSFHSSITHFNFLLFLLCPFLFLLVPGAQVFPLHPATGLYRGTLRSRNGFWCMVILVRSEVRVHNFISRYNTHTHTYGCENECLPGA